MQNQGYSNNQYAQQPPRGAEHPDATMAQILGILSIPLSCSIAIVGLILAIIAMSKSKKGLAEMDADPAKYDPANRSKFSTGKTCSIIGLILSILMMVFWICYVIFIVAMAATGAMY